MSRGRTSDQGPKAPIRWGLTLAYLLLAAVGTYFIVGHTARYRKERFVYAEKHDFKQRLLDMEEWLGENNGPVGGTAVLERAGAHYRAALLWAGGLAAVSLLYLLLAWRWSRGETVPRRKGTALAAVALVCLLTGLLTPMMEIAAYERDLEIPLKFKTSLFSLKVDYTQRFEGDLYFYYQSKSIIELIALLFRQHNFVVGFSILLFSVLIPLFKLVLSGGVLLRPALRDNRLISFALEKTGKWSMADVFVVALFLGYLAFSNMQTGIQADSQVLIGLYFFLAYCLIAIVLPSYLPKGMEKDASSERVTPSQ